MENKRFIIIDVRYERLQKTINLYLSKGWNIYRMDNLYNIQKYKIFFNKILDEDKLKEFDSKNID